MQMQGVPPFLFARKVAKQRGGYGGIVVVWKGGGLCSEERALRWVGLGVYFE